MNKADARAADVGVGQAHRYRDPTVASYVERYGKQCAGITISWGQLFRYFIILAALFVFVSYDYKQFFILVNFVVCAVYMATVLFKLFTVILSLVGKGEVTVTAEEIENLNDEDLPAYTILVPLYRESNVADSIMAALERLDYPREKLDVKFLLEWDDKETLEAVEKHGLPSYGEIVIVPPGEPRTKPRACNHGLRRAKGNYLVIYDAEDRPESDQLKKAIAAFSRLDEKVVCLQAKLNYYNPKQNSLTKWFAMEYSVWFDLFLPGLHIMNVPIPLGGTSNHFRIGTLKRLGGWDPFNVTEDCDLGIRLHRIGCSTKILDTTTWEEANSRLGNWIGQRSRWVKGYIQTHLVHTRGRLKTIKCLGLWGYIGFLMSVGGLCFTLLFNPIYWIMLLFLGIYQWQILYPNDVISVIFYYIAIVLGVGNGIFLLLNVLGCIKRKYYSLIVHALLSPIYWIFMSIAAWKGLFQMLRRPFYWEKTAHGLPGSDSAAGLGTDSLTGRTEA